MPSPARAPWIVLCEMDRRRWGGDLRRAAIYHQLAIMTGALEVQGWGHDSVRGSVRSVAGPPLPWRRRPMLASSEFLSAGGIVQLGRSARAAVLDVHDHPVAQTEALGRPLEPAVRRDLQDRLDRNLAAFPIWTVPSASFAELSGLDPARTVVAPNGSDTMAIRPTALPAEPVIGMVSGAAPGRGIETLIEAARLLRPGEPRLRLFLWLVAGDQIGAAYLERLRTSVAADPWIEIAAVEHARLGEALQAATVLVVPHPANAYMDVAVPVKLLDSMAAGRPVVVTPRTEMRRIVEQAEAGIVTTDDSAVAIAAAVRTLLDDAALATRLGANARAAAERDFDWAVIGRRLAVEVLGRLGLPATDGAVP